MKSCFLCHHTWQSPSLIILLLFLIGNFINLGCPAVTPKIGNDAGEVDGAASFRPYHAQTLLLGDLDNAEVVKVVPGTRRAVVVASKARKISLLEINDAGLRTLQSRTLFIDDVSESELTHLAIEPGGTWAVLTRTLIDKDASGATTACAGSLVFVRVDEGNGFGDILKEVGVGPMPDAVDISPDGRWVVSANERDVVWGKCDGVADLELPSLSLLDVSGGPAQASEVRRVMMSGDSDREPEQVVFSADSDLIAATLQDTHEVLFIGVTDILASEAPTEATGNVFALPKNSIDQDAWPDGIARFNDVTGREVFVVAGEANDTLSFYDRTGTLLSTLEILSADVPASFPRDGSWGPLFRPDSLASFSHAGRVYVAVSLKAAGAIGVWDVSQPERPLQIVIEKVGQDEQADAVSESSLGTEGIAASSAFGFILAANEIESSVSLLLP